MTLQPKFFPVSPEASAKLIIATRLAHGVEASLNLAHAIMRGLWAEERNIGDEETLVQIAVDAGFDGRQLLKTSETASVQAEYDANTETATAANIFGSPWYIVAGEGYWGQDRLDFVERALEK